MVRVLPKLRCPVCGKLAFFPSFVGFYKVEAFVLRIRGLGRGKGFSNTYEKQTPKGDFIAYWIRRLKEVISYLESLQKPKPSMLLSTLPKGNLKGSANLGNLSSTVSVNSASPRMGLKLLFQEKPIGNVRNGLLNSLPVEKVGLILESKVKRHTR